MKPDERPDLGTNEPRRSQLRRILDESPQARNRIGRAIASLGITTLVAIAALGFLLIWHLRRRAGLIRDRLAPPKVVDLIDPLDESNEGRTPTKPESSPPI
jgi:hypothetical protein